MHITSSNNLITFLSATAVVQKKKKKNIGFLEAYGKPIFCSRKIHFTSNCYYIFLKIYVQINQRKRCKTYSCRNFYFVATPPTHAERIVAGSWFLSPSLKPRKGFFYSVMLHVLETEIYSLVVVWNGDVITIVVVRYRKNER